MIPIECIKEAERGHSVLVVGDFLLTFSGQIGKGSLFVRNLRLSGLKSVVVDRVYLIGDMPGGVAAQAVCRMAGTLDAKLVRIS